MTPYQNPELLVSGAGGGSVEAGYRVGLCVVYQ